MRYRLTQLIGVCSLLFVLTSVIWALSSFAYGLLGIVFPMVRHVAVYGFLVFLPLVIHANRCIWLRLEALAASGVERAEPGNILNAPCVLIRWSWFCRTGIGGALIFALFDYESRGTSHDAAQPYLVISLILSILAYAFSSDIARRHSPDDGNMPKVTPE